jgi:ABC-type sugar transport system ATPase subunit
MDVATPGQIQALVGENGAGKSTCLGLVAGRLTPSSGTIYVQGEPLELGSPRASRRAGIHAIYQELTIVPGLSPEANVFLGQNLARRGWLQEKEMRVSYAELCDRLGVEPSRTRRSGALSVADQQLLEIMRAVVSSAQAILLDEPTASLAQAEREALFQTLHQLRSHGLALSLVSHNLDEVLENSDTITVFRDGSAVEGRPASEWTKRELVSSMLGSATRGADIAAGRGQSRSRAPKPVSQQPVLVVDSLTSAGVLHDISFELHRGEILGIAGLVGSGRTSLLRALAGLDGGATGVVAVDGSRAGPPRSVREARRRGIALLPEDRKNQGLVLARSAADNVTLGEWKGLSKLSFLPSRALNMSASKAAASVGFNADRIGAQASSLSGGNQQKLMLARWLYTEHAVLLADEPTRGVDVGAKADILVALEKIVAQGRSLIIVSSELEEVVGLSDRVLVMSRGRVVGLLDSADRAITVETILQMIFDSAAAAPSRS